MAEGSASTSSSSSHNAYMTPPLDENKAHERTELCLADLPQEFHLEAASGTPRTLEMKKDQFFKKLSAAHPRTVNKLLRIVKYVRGPRPKNPRTVGGEQIAFVPLIVGGGDPQHTYRGDSFICAAANQQ
ncbi:hypothetical protein C0993_001167 [Termitomyces sp. T159_Od127]|nr:hypothetical protein C0993_001167 [Termitomyces sp. T159_Od127]